MGGRRMNRPTQLRTNAHPCVIMRYNANLALAHQRKEVWWQNINHGALSIRAASNTSRRLISGVGIGWTKLGENNIWRSGRKLRERSCFQDALEAGWCPASTHGVTPASLAIICLWLRKAALRNRVRAVAPISSAASSIAFNVGASNLPVRDRLFTLPARNSRSPICSSSARRFTEGLGDHNRRSSYVVQSRTGKKQRQFRLSLRARLKKLPWRMLPKCLQERFTPP